MSNLNRNASSEYTYLPELTNLWEEDLKFLDIGCGSIPHGDVNVDFFKYTGFNEQTGDQKSGEYMDPRTIPNFVAASATHLPFKENSFEVAFSSRLIEHLPNPEELIREMCRVSKRKVIIRYPHARGSGAKRPHHLSYIDERRIEKNVDKKTCTVEQFTNSQNMPISNWINSKLPIKTVPAIELYSPYRLLRAIERRLIKKGILKVAPFEVEAWIKKKTTQSTTKDLVFVVVYNDPETLRKAFLSSPFLKPYKIITVYNPDKTGLPTIFNKIISQWSSLNAWFVFCHQDFIIKEDIFNRMETKDKNSVYGPSGISVGTGLMGEIQQTTGTFTGQKLDDCYPVQTLDEQCLIVHSALLRSGLRFDPRFEFHFYGADLCMQAYKHGFDVHAIQLECQHKSKTIGGDQTSLSFRQASALFAEKWQHQFPIRTTTTTFNVKVKRR
jgi:ubiquinone/menaquinone biosynthesis C-methylase UbiE